MDQITLHWTAQSSAPFASMPRPIGGIMVTITPRKKIVEHNGVSVLMRPARGETDNNGVLVTMPLATDGINIPDVDSIWDVNVSGSQHVTAFTFPIHPFGKGADQQLAELETVPTKPEDSELGAWLDIAADVAVSRREADESADAAERWAREAETSAKTPGPAGPDGDKGPAGDKGPTGDKGATGDRGPVGLQGPVGNKGATGDKGPAGDKGPTGNTGGPGPIGTAVPQVAFTTGAPDTTAFYGTSTFTAIRFAAPATGSNVGGGVWDIASGEWTVPITGRYLITANMRLIDGTPTRNLTLIAGTERASAPEAATYYVSGGRAGMVYTRQVQLTAGQKVALMLWHDGGAMTIHPNTTMSITLIGALQTQLPSTGIIDMTGSLPAGLNAGYGANSVVMNREGNRVTAWGATQNTGTSYIVFALPLGYRQSATQGVGGATGLVATGGNATGTVWLENNELRFNASPGGPVKRWSITWLTNDAWPV